MDTKLRKAWSSSKGAEQFDLNVFLESTTPAFFAQARVNALIPNPEWFFEKDLPNLAGIDHVLCKTNDAVEIFSRIGCRARRVGFSSTDRGSPEGLARVEPRFLHVAGASEYKGTEAIIEAWKRHPEWPVVTVVQSPKLTWGRETRSFDVPSNVEYMRRRLEEKDLRDLQQRSAFHLCPSEAEGYGQIIMEGLSAWSVVLTTDGPPMNELVRPEWGVLVTAQFQGRLNLGQRFLVEPMDLEEKIGRLVGLPREDWTAMAREGRRRFDHSRAEFSTRLMAYVGEVSG